MWSNYILRVLGEDTKGWSYICTDLVISHLKYTIMKQNKILALLQIIIV